MRVRKSKFFGFYFFNWKNNYVTNTLESKHILFQAFESV